MTKHLPTPEGVTKRLRKITDPALRAQAAADIKDAIAEARATACADRDVAAMSLIVHSGRDDKAVGALMGFTTRSARMKAGARVKAIHPPAADDTSRNAKYYGAPPAMPEADAEQAVKDAVKIVRRCDAATDEAIRIQHDAMAEMVYHGAPNHEVASAARVSSSYIVKWRETYNVHPPAPAVDVPAPA